MTAVLPADGSAWPPDGHAERYRRMEKPAAWYGGDPGALANAYGSAPSTTVNRAGTSYNPQSVGVVRRIIAAVRNEFWMSSNTDELDTKRHLPVAEDIARASARHLFAERVRIQVIDPSPGKDGERSAVAEAAQRRLDQLVEANGLHALFLAAAETASALGSSCLRLAWDRTAVPDRPVLVRMDPRTAIPHYSWGQLVGVTFWSVVRHDRAAVWRALEMHTGGRVYHALYKGTMDSIGERQPLDAHPVTAPMAQLVDAEGSIKIVEGGATAVSIPNMLPDPLDSRNNVGRSDFTPAVMDLFDSIDRAYSQMMETLEDARSRIFIASHMLDQGKPGEGRSYDPSRRIFEQVKMPPAEKEGSSLPIEQVQFEMHLAEYLQGIGALTRMAVEAAGYNVRSDAGEGGRDVTATEVASDDSKSMATRDTKVLYWQPELARILTTMLRVDVEQFASTDPQTGQRIQALPVSVTFPDSIQPTLLELAQTATALKAAGAASTRELVKVVHPDWPDKMVEDETARILAENQVADPTAIGIGGVGFGG